MKSYKIINLKDIPLEGTHNLPNSRQTLVTKDDVVSENIDAFTKGLLSGGNVWDWHSHDIYDEICVVLKGTGKFYWEDKIENYRSDDVIVIPVGGRHKIVAESDSEFYFVRVKV